MKQLADDVYVLEGFPPHAINVYLLGDVLVDAATRFASKRLLRRLKGHDVTVHALTHVHPDHQGGSHEICQTLGIPLWCGEADVDAMETPGLMMARMPRHWLSATVGPLWAGPPHPVACRLREGDKVGTFTVIETPGHTAGHISFWREADRTLVLGDVLSHLHIYTGLVMLREPESFFTLDPAENRRSAQKLSALEPALVCFGHGPPLRNPRRFADYIARLARP
jgi:hydroxyacylglutathione hydrolase